MNFWYWEVLRYIMLAKISSFSAKRGNSYLGGFPGADEARRTGYKGKYYALLIAINMIKYYDGHSKIHYKVYYNTDRTDNSFYRLVVCFTIERSLFGKTYQIPFHVPDMEKFTRYIGQGDGWEFQQFRIQEIDYDLQLCKYLHDHYNPKEKSDNTTMTNEKFLEWCRSSKPFNECPRCLGTYGRIPSEENGGI